jgi:hypothetical protein
MSLSVTNFIDVSDEEKTYSGAGLRLGRADPSQLIIC